MQFQSLAYWPYICLTFEVLANLRKACHTPPQPKYLHRRVCFDTGMLSFKCLRNVFFALHWYGC